MNSPLPKRPILLLNGYELELYGVRARGQAEEFRAMLAHSWHWPVMGLPSYGPRTNAKEWTKYVQDAILPNCTGVLLIDNPAIENVIIPAYQAYLMGLPVVALTTYSKVPNLDNPWLAELSRSVCTDLQTALHHLNVSIAFQPNQPKGPDHG